jgi:hypothetical protein
MMTASRRARFLLVVVALGCRTRAPGPPNTITITASDSSFAAPDSVPAGLTTLHFVSAGQQLHQAALLRIAYGKSFNDFLAAIKQPGPPPSWVSVAGGVDPPRAGGSADVTIELAPGRYALLCFVPGPDGAPHLVHGMYRELIAVATRRPVAIEPIATDTLSAFDRSYTSGRPIRSGRRTFLFLNGGPQPHEVIFARLVPGKNAQDMVSWLLRPVGTPPGEPLGGVWAMRPSQHAYLTVDVTPGEYALICLLPDRRDGRPQAAHGMVRQFTVK